MVLRHQIRGRLTENCSDSDTKNCRMNEPVQTDKPLYQIYMRASRPLF